MAKRPKWSYLLEIHAPGSSSPVLVSYHTEAEARTAERWVRTRDPEAEVQLQISERHPSLVDEHRRMRKFGGTITLLRPGAAPVETSRAQIRMLATSYGMSYTFVTHCVRRLWAAGLRYDDLAGLNADEVTARVRHVPGLGERAARLVWDVVGAGGWAVIEALFPYTYTTPPRPRARVPALTDQQRRLLDGRHPPAGAKPLPYRVLARDLGVSRERARQLHHETLRQLRNAYGERWYPAWLAPEWEQDLARYGWIATTKLALRVSEESRPAVLGPLMAWQRRLLDARHPPDGREPVPYQALAAEAGLPVELMRDNHDETLRLVRRAYLKSQQSERLTPAGERDLARYGWIVAAEREARFGEEGDDA